MNEKINLYGIECNDVAYAAVKRLQQRGWELTDDFDLSIFRAGYAAAIETMKIEKSKKEDRKNKKFIISDYIDTKMKNREFLKGVFYDSENKAAVVTNGNYLIFTNCDSIPAEYENKIIDKNGVVIEARFPNWKKVVPAESDIMEVDVEKFTSDIVNTDINMSMTMAAAEKSSECFKISDFAMSPKSIKIIAKFLKTQKSVKVYMYKEDTECGCYTTLKEEKAITIEGDTATMVIMPCRKSNITEGNLKYIAA